MHASVGVGRVSCVCLSPLEAKQPTITDMGGCPLSATQDTLSSP